MMAQYTCVLTAFIVVPQKDFTLKCCFIHLKSLCEASHKFFYDKHIVMRSEQKSTTNYSTNISLLLRSASHNDNYFFKPFSQSRRFLLLSQDLSDSRLGVRSVYAFSSASRFAFESARA